MEVNAWIVNQYSVSCTDKAPLGKYCDLSRSDRFEVQIMPASVHRDICFDMFYQVVNMNHELQAVKYLEFQ